MRKIIPHLKENWIRYVFETLVVILGILGAYSLNNWNEQIKKERTEQDLLRRLKTELLDNKNRLKEIINGHQGVVDNMEILIEFFKNDPINKPITLQDSVFNNALRGANRTFNPRIGHLKSIISSGRISYISNDELVAHISEFEDLYVDANEGILRAIQIWDNTLSPLIFRYTEWWRSKEKFGESSFPVDYEGLFGNREVESWIRFIYLRYENSLGQEKELLDKLERIISLIEIELDE